MPRLVHSEPLTVGIHKKIKGVLLGKGHQGIPGLNKNWDRQIVTPCWQAQPCGTGHPNRPVLLHETVPFDDQGGEMGPTTYPLLEQIRPPDLD